MTRLQGGFFRPSISLRWVLFALLLVGLFAAETAGLRRVYTSRNPGGNDLLPRWVAARAWLLEGLNPYDLEIERRGQEMIYGRAATNPGEDLARFLYLPYAMLFVAPVALLPYDWAQAAWMTLLQFCLLGMMAAAFRLYRWSPRPWLAAALALWAIVVYPGARSLLLGQLTLVMALLIVLGLWAIRERRDWLAGALLALSTAKPTLAVLLIPLVFAWSVAVRRWRLAGALAAAFGVLALFSFAVAPRWPWEVIRQAQGYTGYTDIGSVANILAREAFPWLGALGEYGLTALLLGWTAWEWWRARGGDMAAFQWAAAVTLVATVIVSPRTGTTSQPVLFPALVMLFARADQGGRALARLYLLLTLIVTAVGLWWLFVVTVAGRVEQPQVYLPLPLGIAGALALAGRPLRQAADKHRPSSDEETAGGTEAAT